VETSILVFVLGLIEGSKQTEFLDMTDISLISTSL